MKTSFWTYKRFNLIKTQQMTKWSTVKRAQQREKRKQTKIKWNLVTWENTFILVWFAEANAENGLCWLGKLNAVSNMADRHKSEVELVVDDVDAVNVTALTSRHRGMTRCAGVSGNFGIDFNSMRWSTVREQDEAVASIFELICCKCCAATRVAPKLTPPTQRCALPKNFAKSFGNETTATGGAIFIRCRPSARSWATARHRDRSATPLCAKSTGTYRCVWRPIWRPTRCRSTHKRRQRESQVANRLLCEPNDRPEKRWKRTRRAGEKFNFVQSESCLEYL